MKELGDAISMLRGTHLDEAFLVTGDFVHINFWNVNHKFHKNVSCSTWGDNTLDHIHTNITEAYTAISLPHPIWSTVSCPKAQPLLYIKPSVKTVNVWL